MQLNYSKLLIKKKENLVTKEQKWTIIDETIALIGSRFKELCFKHDGCRVIQAMLKYGNRAHRITVIDAIKEYYIQLMSNKYSHYLASKAYYYAPEPEQKQYFRSLVMAEINGKIVHAVILFSCLTLLVCLGSY